MRKWKATQNDDQNDDRTMTILLVSESDNLTIGNLNLQASFGRGNTSKWLDVLWTSVGQQKSRFHWMIRMVSKTDLEFAFDSYELLHLWKQHLLPLTWGLARFGSILVRPFLFCRDWGGRSPIEVNLCSCYCPLKDPIFLACSWWCVYILCPHPWVRITLWLDGSQARMLADFEVKTLSINLGSHQQCLVAWVALRRL